MFVFWGCMICEHTLNKTQQNISHKPPTPTMAGASMYSSSDSCSMSAQSRVSLGSGKKIYIHRESQLGRWLLLFYFVGYPLHPRNLTWNLRIHPWKRKIIFQTIIFRFYVNVRGCTSNETVKPLTFVGNGFVGCIKQVCIFCQRVDDHPKANI